MRRIACSLLWVCFISAPACAQLLTWSPLFPKDNDNVVITLDASKGNQALFNYTPTSDVYVHIGLITSASTSPTNWQYSKFAWGSTTAAAQATYIGGNKWQYTVTNVRAFFNPPAGVPPGETIYKIAILFRNGTGSVVQRNLDGSDMYIPIYGNTIATRFTVPLMQPTYRHVPEPFFITAGNSLPVTAYANMIGNMSILLNGTVIHSQTTVDSIKATPVITVTGMNRMIVQATSGTTASDTFDFFVAPPINVAPVPAGNRDGINYEAGNTSAVLVLYAPNKSRVTLAGEFPGLTWQETSAGVMNKSPDGNYWWMRVTGLTPGTEYAFQYIVDGSIRTTDPYVEKILDPSYDSQIPASTYPGLRSYPPGATGIVGILQTNAPGYTWANNSFVRPDKRNLVIYELLLRDFLEAHDWSALRDTLNYLANLGVNAIEVMPFNEFEGNSSWGYNPDFHLAPDKYYGPKNMLKRFIDSCHGRGIAVIMDMVLNHATGLSPLAQLYWNGTQPAANSPYFNVTARHPFNVFNDFNHESPATRYFSSRVMEHWLTEYKLDGFRFDLSKGFTQVNSCTTPSCDSQAEINNWGNHDNSRILIWKYYYDILQLQSPGSYVILEHFAAQSEEIELSNYGMLLWGNGSYNFQEAAMGWISNSDFDHLIYTDRNWTKPHLVGYMESHDEERMMYKNITAGNSSGSYNTRDLNTALKRMEQAAAFLLSIPGPKLIWEFGELGYDFSINRCVNGTISNSCRLDPKPIRWDYLQVIQRKRLYDIYASLLKLRAHSWYKDVFIANNTTISWNMAGAMKYLLVRSATDSSMLAVIGNFDVTPQTITFTFPSAGTWYDYLNALTFTSTGSSQNITLQPGQFHIYLNRNLVNAVVTPVTNPPSTGNDYSLQVFPNPVNGNASAELHLQLTGKTELVVMNNIGQAVKTIYSGILLKGKNILPLGEELNKLPSGHYILKATTGNKNIHFKFVINH